MKEIFCLTWLSFFCFFISNAQPPGTMFDFRHPAAGVFSNAFNSPAAGYIMPAAFAISKADFLLIGKKPFMLKEISELEAFVNVPIAAGTGSGFALSRFGNENFSEISIASGIGRKLTKHLLFGVSGEYIMRLIKGVSRTNSINLATSVQLTLPNFQVGSFFHFNAKQFNPDEIGQYLAGAGIGKDWSEEFYADFSFSYATHYGLNFSLSLQYQVVRAFKLAISIETNPGRYGIETGYVYHSMSLRVGNCWHPELGWSPSLFLGFSPFRNRQSNAEIPVN